MRIVAIGLAASLTIGLAGGSGPDDPAVDDRGTPAAFATIEGLVGAWKGTAVPTANRLKGWPERHVWSWKFRDGRPVAFEFEAADGRLLTRGSLTHDPATGKYTLDGLDAANAPSRFVGVLDAKTGALVLDREGDDKPRERITIRPNANGVRYTFWLDRREPGAPQFKRAIEAGLTREGESFAAGGDQGPTAAKCIITGGTASMTVAFAGKTYPICCTGCRDEFEADPEKYVAKAALRAGGGTVAPAAKVDPPAAPAEKDAEKPTAKAPAKKAAPAASRAASLLAVAQALEKQGKPAAALENYRRIVEQFPGTPQAKAAAGRIEAIGPR